MARHKGFTRAAEREVTASDAVSNLENRLGVRLLDRTTRNVSLTDAGAMLHASLAPAFDAIAAALDSVNQFRDTPFGKVRLNVPNSFAPFVLGDVLGPLISAHPNLKLESLPLTGWSISRKKVLMQVFVLGKASAKAWWQ